MDDKHLSDVELKGYAQDAASADFLRVHEHLEKCDACSRRINDMFQNAVIDEITTLLDETGADKLFHLDYENHLKPYVDETVGAVDKELIESHVETCLRCRDDLRDIINFHEELQREVELKHLSRARPWTNLAEWLFDSTRRMAWVAFASIMIVAGAGAIWVYFNNVALPRPEIAYQDAAIPTVDEIADQKPSPDALSIEPDIAVKTIEKAVNAAQKGDETEFAALKLPGFLRDLRPEIQATLRGRGSGDETETPITVISPNGRVIRESSPVLTWKKVPNTQNYEVAVFDENDNRIAKSESFGGNSWRVSNLAKGKLYQWQVSAKIVSSDGKTTNFIGKGKFYIASQAGENRINQAKDPFDKGKAFAEAGLLREAANEFRKYLAQNPNSAVAKEFLRQVEQARRL